MSQMDRSERNSSRYLLEQNAALIGICFIFQCFIFIQDRQAVALTDLKFSGQNVSTGLSNIFSITKIKRNLGQQTERIGQCNAIVILFHSYTKSTLF